MDWKSGNNAHVLVYARQGTWFGHQNNAESWPFLLVNTTIYRPDNFQNDGYIPIESKRASAIIPRKDFTPLEMKIGETWSFYVCTSLGDLRYSLGSSIGSISASNTELRIMEGAGAADYPPFEGGNPEEGGVEYTFYAPRVFNGILRYDFVGGCPDGNQGSTSATDSSPQILTTMFSYQFYVEHDPDILNGEITYDISLGVRAALDMLMDDLNDELRDDLLFSYKTNDNLVIETVVAELVSPSDIGCKFDLVLISFRLYIYLTVFFSPLSWSTLTQICAIQKKG